MIRILAMKEAYLKSEDGSTAVEYSLFIVAIALAIVAVLFSLGGQLGESFGALGEAVSEELQ